MKILSATQLSKIDQLSIQKQSITSWELMERASLQAVDAILPYLKKSPATIHIFCGIGNNGGDGLAIAYHLHKLNYNLKVYKVAFAEQASQDFQLNAKRLSEENIPLNLLTNEKEEKIEINEDEILIDAIFGVGLNRRMPNFVEDLVKQINQSQAFCISVDIPSGMFLNQANPDDAACIQADVCISFQLPKLPLLLPGTGKFVSYFQIVPIGLSQEAIADEPTQYHYLNEDYAGKLYKKPQRFSHKGTQGHGFLVGGQKGMIGSILLSAKAALKSGLGKLSVMLPNLGHSNLHSFIPEALAVNNPSQNYIQFTALDDFDAVGIGMGIGTSKEALSTFRQTLAKANKPLLIDADALNLLAEKSDLLSLIPENSVLTPHAGELKRLIGNWQDDFEKLDKIKIFAKKHKCIVVAKEAYTCICDGENYYFNATGNAGMATAGSGDVLSGIITSLLAQNYLPLQAAQLGVYIHGLAADLALQQESQESLIASDIISYLGKAFKQISDF